MPIRAKLQRLEMNGEMAMRPHEETYCAPCRDRYRRELLWAKGREQFRQIGVTGRDEKGRVLCFCKACGHRWASVSAEAARLLERAMAPKPPQPVKRRPVRPIETAGQLSLI